MTDGALRLLDVAPDADRTRRQVGRWLTTTATLQHAYGRLLADTLPLIGDPLARRWLEGVEASAQEHERAVAPLAGAFGLRRRPPEGLARVAGAVLGRGRELAGRVQGRAAGAAGPVWRNLRQLQLSNLDAMSAYAVVQQLGLAQGRPRVVEIVFPVVAKKSEQQLLLQELYLEYAADAVLLARDL